MAGSPGPTMAGSPVPGYLPGNTMRHTPYATPLPHMIRPPLAPSPAPTSSPVMEGERVPHTKGSAYVHMTNQSRVRHSLLPPRTSGQELGLGVGAMVRPHR
eukprot:44773-Prorocentrum_minimum.AAC.1